ncbi:MULTISPECIES: bifunctional diguanylate cyclase/phosphodiesterase [Aliivibrio]|uniref:bifunctional diguanylate cyclase/phosphodiesterase n=1 Tax=Aliivibrio TaxID=511678 RepID=UPI0003A080F2|nr:MULTISPECIES: cache domain-containing protein [Aliivibrio]
MPRQSDKKLLMLISIMPIVLIGVFTFVLNAMVIHENRSKVEILIESVYRESVDQQKDQIKHQVENIFQQIEYERNLAETTLKKRIKERVDDGYNTIRFIYEKNRDKTKAEQLSLISNALRQVRFNEGRGYFFIHSMDGINIMHPIFPEFEGTDISQFQDVRGTFVHKELTALLKKKGEGFSRWWYPKPNGSEQEFEKIGYAKYFKPLDLYISTGEYIFDIEHDIQARLLSWISEIRYGKNGYIFLLDSFGNVLAHYNKEFVSPQKYTVDTPNPMNLTKKMLEIAQKGEGFIEYTSSFKPATLGPAEKLSYIKGYKPWGWAIGAGIYTADTEKLLEEKEQMLIVQNEKELMKILLLTLTLAFILTLLSLAVSRYVEMRFNRFKTRIHHDFTTLEKTKNKMQHMALHDSLTQLPNRVMLESKIELGIQRAELSEKKLAVMFVDLDDFKKINDRFGHEVGDVLLKKISSKFSRMLKGQDIVARFGGDEFVFCFPLLTSVEEAEVKVELIKSVFNEQFLIHGKEISTSCSIGVAMYPSDANNSTALISKADIVLYKSKEKQKGGSLFFDQSIDDQVSYEFHLEEELRFALDRSEIFVCYQPQINIQTGKLCGVEALCRWNNKKLGFVSPVDFIAAAEEIGIIDSIGDFVLQRACEDLLAFMPNGKEAAKVSVNISPKQLIQPNFIQRVMHIIEQTGIDVSRVVLEITENILISELDNVSPILQKLQQLGFGISLDDFGTGYSSLSYLNILPITEIKIDRTFINSLFVNEQSETLVKAIIAIGASCQMTVVAEGVETKEQFDKLKEYQCDLVQGYYFDKPLSIEDLRSRYRITPS